VLTWIEGLLTEDITISLPDDTNPIKELVTTSQYRLDCQGLTTNQGHEIRWLNLQIQINTKTKQRSKNDKTSVLTTFVHYNGYHHTDLIDSKVILKKMKKQVYWAKPESCIFVRADLYAVNMVSKHPKKLLEHPKYGTNFAIMEDKKWIGRKSIEPPKRRLPSPKDPNAKRHVNRREKKRLFRIAKSQEESVEAVRGERGVRDVG
jgi:hypothetical protein